MATMKPDPLAGKSEGTWLYQRQDARLTRHQDRRRAKRRTRLLLDRALADR